MITPDGMMQIGYGCGLSTMDEAYSMIMSHYDVFFLIENFAAEREEFFQKCKDAGLLIPDKNEPNMWEWKHETIQEAADFLGIVLQDIDNPETISYNQTDEYEPF